MIVKYFIYLLYQIYCSGFSTIKKIVTGKVNPGIVEITTKLENDFLISILACSITLTPGTVTLDKDGKKLKILWLDCITKDSEAAGAIIKGNFEDILKEGERRC